MLQICNIFYVTIPTHTAIKALVAFLFDAAAKMPWEDGNSWVKGVETGISGFSNYMYLTRGEGKLSERSRSGTGLQTNKTLNAGIFKPTKYITEILDKYRERLAQ